MTAMTGIVLVSAIAGCAAKPPIDDGELVVLAGKADFSSEMRLYGRLAPGAPATAAHQPPPKYGAFRLAARAGEELDVWVRSTDGDAVAWLVDAAFEPLALNDDAAPGTNDAHLLPTAKSAGDTMLSIVNSATTRRRSRSPGRRRLRRPRRPRRRSRRRRRGTPISRRGPSRPGSR
jgi:hypothetical protein